MEENEMIIDLGVWNCPKDWSDLTLKQFCDLQRFYSDKDKDFDAREVLHILCNKSVDEVNQLPIEFTEAILSKMEFLTTSPEYGKPSNKLKVNGEEYIINTQNKMKTGEYIAVTTSVKSDPFNYAAILAVLARKQDEIYDSKFENEILEERIKMFENIPALQAMPSVAFFLNLWAISALPSQLRSKVADAINHTANRILSLRNAGLMSKLATRLQMRKLKKLQKYIKSI